MSETKSKDSNGSLEAEPQSSKDILNELFSTFNTSFDADAAEANHRKKKKKRKAKKSKKSKEKNQSSSGGDDGNSAGGDAAPSPSKPKSPSTKKRSKGKEKQVSSSSSTIVDKIKGQKSSARKRRRSKEDEDAEDVDDLIAKHRKNLKKKFKGIVSNYGDMVINNDELLRNKKRKHEDLKEASITKDKLDVEDGEILDEDEGSLFNRLAKKDKQKKKHSIKLSASQAYKLDVEEKILLGIDPMEDNKYHSHHHHSHQDGTLRSKSRSKSESRSHSARPDRRKSHEDRQEETSSSSFRTSSSSNSKRLSGEVENHVRQAPPRDPSPPQDSRGSPTPSNRSYSYNDTGWQRERDHKNESSGGSSSSRRRENRDNRDEVNGYYDREASRRSDGRTGFGFVSRSYYDDPVENKEGDKDKDRGRSHSQSHHHHHSHTRGRSPSPSRNRSRSSKRSSRSPPPRWRRSRSRSRERYRHPDDIIDKAKLLEIARKNAAKLMRRGVLPTEIFSRDQIMAIRAGGKSVDELTDYCKRIAKKDARGDAISDDSGGSDGEQHFIHHPFHVKDRPLPQITMNIRNAIPIPLRTPHELAIEGAKLKVSFPVSSGTQHRIKELEWHPVDKEEEEKKAKATEDANKSLVPLDGPKVGAEVAAMVQSNDKPEAEVPLQVPPPAAAEAVHVTSTNAITLDHPKPPEFDISDVIAIRLRAMRQLSENPQSDEAKKHLEDATQMMKRWADAKALEPKFLSQSELTQGPQAWAKRDQLTNAKEVQSPMGLHLLQKMGWKPGEGLGKTRSGDTEPLALEVKTDKKGLTSVLDYKKGPAMPLVFDLSSKHPISALMELCAKRKWGSPDFELVFEHGPPHKKQFVYKVTVNGVEYQPCVAVNNKKLSKANAAAFCLQSLGLLPTAKPQSSSETLQTVHTLPPPPPPSVAPTGATFSGVSAAGPSPVAVGRFTTSHYLQTVPSATIPNQPPPPPEVLMPPPPPPPLLKRFLN